MLLSLWVSLYEGIVGFPIVNASTSETIMFMVAFTSLSKTIRPIRSNTFDIIFWFYPTLCNLNVCFRVLNCHMCFLFFFFSGWLNPLTFIAEKTHILSFIANKQHFHMRITQIPLLS